MDHYILARRALGPDFLGALLITGPAGSGKTMGVIQTVKRLNLEHGLALNLLKMDCATITDPQKWIGRREIDEKGTTFIESDFLRAVRDGWVILLDEISRLHPTMVNLIMSLLDGSQALHLSDMNVTVEVHPETVFLGTANIGVQYGGTHRMDWAMRERFAFTLERGWPPRDEEIRILTSQTGVDPDGAAMLVDIAIRSRSLFETGDVRSPISTRTLVAAAWFVASGMNERDALSYTAVPLYDTNANGLASEQSERMIIAGAIEGKTGS
jgi:nitric oxide reductase NorQ protein